MGRYITLRLAQMIPVLLVVSVVAFVLVALLPGDAASAMAGGGAEYYNPDAIEQVRKDFGLDKPLPIRYVMWMGSVLRGNLGRSLRNNQKVSEAIAQRSTVSLALAGGALVIGVGAGVSLGIVAAINRGSWLDRGLTLIATLGLSVPHFWLGILLVILFSQWLRWLPAFGYIPPEKGLLLFARNMMLPWITACVGVLAEVTRQTRSSLLDVLGQDFIRTARAKGLGDRIVIWKHALRNALIPVVTVTGLAVGRLLSGAVVTETVFSLPGLGSLAVTAFGQRDFTVIQATILFSAVVTIFASLIADLAYAWVDPRISYS
jgi:peptide/nickel transport system permease protein